jgi:hypothetical protein
MLAGIFSCELVGRCRCGTLGGLARMDVESLSPENVGPSKEVFRRPRRTTTERFGVCGLVCRALGGGGLDGIGASVGGAALGGGSGLSSEPLWVGSSSVYEYDTLGTDEGLW